MIKLRNERVVSFTREYYDIYWEVEPTTEDLQEYQFFVERSESEGGPWIPISGAMIDRYYLRDNTIPAISANRLMFYRIRVYHPSSGREFTSKIIDRERDLDIVATEMVRLERVLFEEFTGVQCWLLPRRTFGQRCPQCYDDVLGKRTQDFCPTCYNTTFSGGFHYPISFWAQVDRPESAEQASIEDHRQTKYFVMRCGPSPFIKPMDVIIDHVNRRHRVLSVGGTTRLGSPVHQEIRTVEVQRGSIEDRYPLKIDLETVKLRPSRNYYVPHNLEAADVEFDLDAVLGPYRY
jgi:hypothetical protein